MLEKSAETLGLLHGYRLISVRMLYLDGLLQLLPLGHVFSLLTLEQVASVDGVDEHVAEADQVVPATRRHEVQLVDAGKPQIPSESVEGLLGDVLACLLVDVPSAKAKVDQVEGAAFEH